MYTTKQDSMGGLTVTRTIGTETVSVYLHHAEDYSGDPSDYFQPGAAVVNWAGENGFIDHTGGFSPLETF